MSCEQLRIVYTTRYWGVWRDFVIWQTELGEAIAFYLNHLSASIISLLNRLKVVCYTYTWLNTGVRMCLCDLLLNHDGYRPTMPPSTNRGPWRLSTKSVLSFKGILRLGRNFTKFTPVEDFRLKEQIPWNCFGVSRCKKICGRQDSMYFNWTHPI